MPYEITLKVLDTPLWPHGVTMVIDSSEEDARKIHTYFSEQFPDEIVTLALREDLGQSWEMLIGQFHDHM